MRQLKKLKGYWVFLIAALVCWTLLGRADADIYSVGYSGSQFRTRWLTDYDLDSTQPQAYVGEGEGAVAVLVLRDVSALSLKAGTYDAALTYRGTDSSSVLKIFSSDYTSPDNSGGKIFLCETLDPEQGYFAAELGIDQDVNSVYILVETTDPAFSIESLHLAGRERVCTDTAYYCALAFLAAIAVFALINGRFAHVAPGTLGNGTTVPPNRVALCCALIGASTVLIASLPLLQKGMIDNSDLSFHLARIEGLASGLASGQFPVRVHGELLNGFGYPNSFFYPELLLYVPAILTLMGVHVITSYKFYLIFIHALTFLLSYLPFKKMMRSRSLAMALSVAYVLNPYRLIRTYYRSATGEFTAMAFLPLVLYGLYAVLQGRKKDWPYLVIGATGLIQSHILSTELTAFLCVVITLGFVRQLFTGERRIFSLLTASVYTVLLNAWFLFPMLIVSITIRPQVFERMQYPSRFAQYDIGELFSTISVLPGANAVMAGWVSLFGIALYLLYRVASPALRQYRLHLRFFDILAAASIVGAFATTAYFPWDRVTQIPVVGRMLDVIQFPYRLMILVSAGTTAVAGYAVLLWLKKESHRKAACVGIACLSVFTACLLCEYISRNADLIDPKHTYANNMNNSICVSQYEYLAAGASIDDMVGFSPKISSDNKSLTVSGWERAGTNMRFDYRMTPDPDGDHSIALPLTYIPNYDVRVNGQRVALSRTLTARVAFDPPCAEGTVTVRYREPKLFRLCELVSVLTLLVLIFRRPLAAALQRLPVQRRKAARTASSPNPTGKM